MKSFMYRVVAVLGLMIGLVGGSAAGANGQDAPPPATQTVEAETPAAAPASDPLPTPDFTRAYRHVFLAFAFAWVLIFAYAMLIDRRIAQVSEELERLG